MAETEEQAFLRRAVEHIELCNIQAKDTPGEKVAMAALYGVARYCAHLCRSRHGNATMMAERRDEAIAMFSDEFNRVFADWYDHYTDLPE